MEEKKLPDLSKDNPTIWQSVTFCRGWRAPPVETRDSTGRRPRHVPCHVLQQACQPGRPAQQGGSHFMPASCRRVWVGLVRSPQLVTGKARAGFTNYPSFRLEVGRGGSEAWLSLIPGGGWWWRAPARQEMILILLDIGIPVQRNAGVWAGLKSRVWSFDVTELHISNGKCWNSGTSIGSSFYWPASQ